MSNNEPNDQSPIIAEMQSQLQPNRCFEADIGLLSGLAYTLGFEIARAPVLDLSLLANRYLPDPRKQFPVTIRKVIGRRAHLSV